MTDENDVLGKAPDVMVRLEALWNEVAKTHSLEALQDWRDCIWTAFPNIHAEVKRLRADNARLREENECLRLDQARRSKEMNTVTGVATTLMLASGMSWKERVANLCNFTGDLDDIVKDWRDAERVAAERIASLRKIEAAAGKDAEQIIPILQAFAEARLHGQQKYWGVRDDDGIGYDDPRRGDLSHALIDWLGFIVAHLERAKLGGDKTMDCRDHLIKAGGLILSAVWTQDIHSGRAAIAGEETK
jgi:hypothetical protein